MAAPLKATFFALRRRARGGVLARATFVHAVLPVGLLCLFALFVVATGAGFAERAAGPVVAWTRLGGAAAFALFYAFVTASYEAACLRWMIRSETAGFGGFSFGGDTWRAYAGSWIWFAVSLGLWVVVIVLSALAIAAFNLADEMQSQEWAGFGAMAFWILLVTPFALRMSTGNAVSLVRRRFSYFEGWKVSANRVRALAGSFLIAWVIWLVVFLALFAGGSFLVFSSIPDSADESQRVNTLMVVNLAFALLCSNLMLSFLSAGINARAALAAIEEGKLEGVGVSANVAEVFD